MEKERTDQPMESGGAAIHPRARRHLMLETSAVVEIHDLRFAYNSPVKDARPILERQGEHEAGVSGAWVLIEDGVFKCWHRMHSTSVAGEWAGECPVVAYAESTDGIHWERPELGILEFRGSRKNNYTDLPSTCCSILPDVSGEHKYLAIGTMAVEPGPREVRPQPSLGSGYFTAHSDDGLHWQVHTEPIVLTGCDVCYATYDQIERRYVFIPKLLTRYAGVQARTMCWTDAKEFGKWGPIRPILSPSEGDFLEARRHEAIGMDFQYMTILPYRDITLGFVSCFYLDPSYIPGGGCTHGRNNVQLAWQEKRIRQGGFHPLYPDQHEYNPRVEEDSPYGSQWRFLPGRPAFIQWGTQRGVESDVYPNTMLEVGDEMWMYYGASRQWHGETEVKGAYEFVEDAAEFSREVGTSWVGRVTMKRDRFASLWANFRGMVEVRHGPRDGAKLLVNAKCPRGSITAELVDQRSYQTVAGFEKENCRGFSGDSVRGEVLWKDGDVSTIAPDVDLTIRFFVRTGDLFAYEFGQ